MCIVKDKIDSEDLYIILYHHRITKLVCPLSVGEETNLAELQANGYTHLQL